MLARYAGRIINGRPAFLEPITLPVTLPENTDITIMVELPAASHAQTHTAAVQFLAGVEKINKEDFTSKDKEAFSKFDNGEYRLRLDRVLDV